MMRYCGWCRTYMGKKAPLLDDRETTGMCDDCFAKLKRKNFNSREALNGKAERMVNCIRCDTSIMGGHGGDSPVGDVLKQIEETRKFDAHYLEEARKDGFKC